jgi:hypothetical protein
LIGLAAVSHVSASKKAEVGGQSREMEFSRFAYLIVFQDFTIYKNLSIDKRDKRRAVVVESALRKSAPQPFGWGVLFLDDPAGFVAFSVALCAPAPCALSVKSLSFLLDICCRLLALNVCEGSTSLIPPKDTKP